MMGVPAVMVDEDGNRIPGVVPDEEIRKHPDRHSRAVMKDFYRTSEFCAACHKANLPNPLNDYKFIRAFTAYDEWQNSKFSTAESADVLFHRLHHLPGLPHAAGAR